MKENLSIKKTIIYIAVFAGLIALTMMALLKGQDPEKLWGVVKGVDPGFLAGAGVLAMSFVFFEGANIHRILRVLNYKVSYLKCIKYAMAGYFFSAITPSASGGQPMQIYTMKKDNIQVSHSSITLLMELLCFQGAACLYGSVAMVMALTGVFSANHYVLLLAVVGLALGLGMFVFLAFAIFSKRISAVLMRFLIGLVKKLPFLSEERKTGFASATAEQFEEYAACSQVIKGNKRVLIKVFATVAAQLGFQFAIAALAYFALGQTGVSVGTLVMMQALVFLCTSFVPLPGAVGASETVFLAVFGAVYSTGLAGAAMILTRGIAFYIPVLLCGAIIMTLMVKDMVKPAGKLEQVKEAVAKKAIADPGAAAYYMPKN